MTRRLLASYLAITVAVLAILTFPFARTFERKRLNELNNVLVLDAFLIATQVEESVAQRAGRPIDVAWLNNYTRNTDLRVVVVSRNGSVVIDSSGGSGAQETLGTNMASRPEITELFASRSVQTGTRVSKTLGYELAYVVVPVSRDDQIIGAVRVSFSTTAVRQDVLAYWRKIAAVALVSLLLVAAIGVVLSRSIARPIRELERAAVEFGEGRLDRRAPDSGGPPEVASLRTAYNSTADRLEMIVRRQQTFVADASHQLRTPLTGLRLRLENLDTEVTDFGREDLEQAIAQTDRLSRLVDGLLTLARADRPTTWNDSTPLQLSPFLQSRVTDWEPFATERGIDLSAMCQPDLTALSNADRLTQVVDNLIANAFDALAAANTPNGTIRLVGWPQPVHAEIHVVDNGPGLSADQRARAFDRFWRADPSKSDGFGGTGLGLSIAASMLTADKGTIRLEEAEGGGLDAVVCLTRADIPDQRPTTPASERRRWWRSGRR